VREVLVPCYPRLNTGKGSHDSESRMPFEVPPNSLRLKGNSPVASLQTTLFWFRNPGFPVGVSQVPGRGDRLVDSETWLQCLISSDATCQESESVAIRGIFRLLSRWVTTSKENTENRRDFGFGGPPSVYTLRGGRYGCSPAKFKHISQRRKRNQ